MPFQDCKGCKKSIRTPFEYCGDPCKPEMFEEEKPEREELIADVNVPMPPVSEESLDVG